jgi:hypothetical protein
MKFKQIKNFATKQFPSFGLTSNLQKFRFSDKVVINKEINYNENLLTDLYLKEKSQQYFDSIEKHRKTRIPFLDHSTYKNMLEATKPFSLDYLKRKNEFLDSFYILEKYVTLNMEILSTSDFIEYIEEFSKVKYFKFDFWFYVEKHIIKNLNKFNNDELSKLIYNLAFAEVCSNYLWKLLAERVLDIQPKNFTENEFILVYNAFKIVKIENKLLWAFLNRTLIEVYPHLKEEN